MSSGELSSSWVTLCKMIASREDSVLKPVVFPLIPCLSQCNYTKPTVNGTDSFKELWALGALFLYMWKTLQCKLTALHEYPTNHFNLQSNTIEAISGVWA